MKNPARAAASVDQVRTAILLGNTLKFIRELPNNVLAAPQPRLHVLATAGGACSRQG